MARGHQKAQSQQKGLERAEKQKKQNSHSSKDQKKAAEAGLTVVCEVCRSRMPDNKTFREHFENKHPKSPLPEILRES